MSLRERLGSLFSAQSSISQQVTEFREPTDANNSTREPETPRPADATVSRPSNVQQDDEDDGLATALRSFAKRHEHVFFSSRARVMSSSSTMQRPTTSGLDRSSDTDDIPEALQQVRASRETTSVVSALPPLEEQFVRIRSRATSPVAAKEASPVVQQHTDPMAASVQRHGVDNAVLHHFGGYAALLLASSCDTRPSLVCEAAMRERDVVNAAWRASQWPLLSCVASLTSARYHAPVVCPSTEEEPIIDVVDFGSPVRSASHGQGVHRGDHIAAHLLDFFHSYDPKHVPTSAQIEAVSHSGIPESVLFGYLRLRFGLPVSVEATVLAADPPADVVCHHFDKDVGEATPSPPPHSSDPSLLAASPDFGVTLEDAEASTTATSHMMVPPQRPQRGRAQRVRGGSIAAWPMEWREAVMPLVVHIMGGEFAPNSRAAAHQHSRGRSWSANDGQDGPYAEVRLEPTLLPTMDGSTPVAEGTPDDAPAADGPAAVEYTAGEEAYDDKGRRWNSTASRHGLANPLTWFPEAHSKTQLFTFFGVTHQLSHDTCDVIPLGGSADEVETVEGVVIPVRQSNVCSAALGIPPERVDHPMLHECIGNLGQHLVDATLSWSSAAARSHSLTATCKNLVRALEFPRPDAGDVADLGTLVQNPVRCDT